MPTSEPTPDPTAATCPWPFVYSEKIRPHRRTLAASASLAALLCAAALMPGSAEAACPTSADVVGGVATIAGTDCAAFDMSALPAGTDLLITGEMTGNVKNIYNSSNLALGNITVLGKLTNTNTGTDYNLFPTNSVGNIYFGPDSLLTLNSGNGVALMLNGTAFTGSITTDGRIVAPTGVAMRLIGTTVNGDVTNNGTGELWAYYLRGQAITLNGNLTNNGTISTTRTFTQGYGFRLQRSVVNGNITNAGTMTGLRGTDGVLVTAGIRMEQELTTDSSVTGTILNSGTISGFDAGVFLTQSTVGGDIVNSGRMTNLRNGISLATSGTVRGLSNSGTITVSETGILASGTWTVTTDVSNSGTITASDTGASGISLTGITVGGNISSSNEIKARNHGIGLTNVNAGATATTTQLTNSGTITTAGAAGTTIAAGLYASGSNLAAVKNEGANAKILKAVDGISLTASTITGTVSNGGTIEASQYGIGLTGTVASSAGSLTNSGSITAGTAGLIANDKWMINGDVANLSGGSLLGTGDGISLTGTTVTGAVGNAGTIDVDGTGIKLESLSGPITSLVNSGTLTADATGISASGFDITGDAGNTGTITALGADADGILLKDTTVGGVIANNGKATINATRYGIGLTGTGSTKSFTNSGKITAGTAGLYTESDWTISGDVANLSNGSLLGAGDGIWLTDTTVTGAIANAGTIDVDGYGMWLETLGGPIKSLVNSGSMAADTSGIVSIGNAISGDAGNTGTITALGADADGILLHRSTVGGNIANDAGATIEATRYGIGLTGTGSAKSFINRGTITADEAGMYAEDGWTISGDVANYSSNSLLGTGDGISLTGTTVTGAIGNAGTIAVGRDGVSLAGTTLRGGILNTGSVTAGRFGFALADAGAVSAFDNLGTITGGTSGISATGSTRIGTLTNAQAGLTYAGTLPTNYHTLINGQSYGQLFVDPVNHAGQTTFALSPLSDLTLALGEAPRTYGSVLTGVASSELANPGAVVAHIGKRGQLFLEQQAGSETTWDLVMKGLWTPFIGYDDPEVDPTVAALRSNQQAINRIFAERSAALSAAAQYDCDRFDVNGFCVQIAGRATTVDGEAETAAVFNAAARLTSTLRMGLYLDQQASQTDSMVGSGPGSVAQDYDMPLFGAYLGYAAQEDGTGLQARASTGYMAGDLDIRRGTLTQSEPASGSAALEAFYARATLGYGILIGRNTRLTPYIGLDYTSLDRDGYSEAYDASETLFPITYDSYHDRLLSGLAGAEVTGLFNEDAGYRAALGVAFDLARDANGYGGHSEIPGLETIDLSHDQGSRAEIRPMGLAELFLDPAPNQRISATAFAAQDAWSEDLQATGLIAYRFSF